METGLIVGYVFFGVFLLLGVIFTPIGIGVSKGTKKRIMRCTAKTNAKIIKIVTENIIHDYGNPAIYSYFPVIEYSVENESFQRMYNIGFKKDKYKIGEEIEIMYNPEKPEDFYFVGDNSGSKVGKVFSIIGPILLFLSFVALIMILSLK